MKLRTISSVVALALGAALTLTACGNGDDEPTTTPSPEETEPTNGDDPAEGNEVGDGPSGHFHDVYVSGPFGEEPTITISSPLDVDELVIETIMVGTGPAIEPGQLVTTHYSAVLNDGEPIESTWENGQPLTLTQGASGADWMDAVTVVGATVGSRVLLAFPTIGPEGVDTVVIVVVDIIDAMTVPTRAEGEHVTPPAGLPEITLGTNGAPSLGEVPAAYRDVTELIAQPLIIGDGPVVTADDFLTVHYTGWLTDGTVFDSSWARNQTAGFPLRGVIAGWTEGLSGQTVGSQVLLIIPPDMGYGEAGQPPSIPGDATLIFVVDILMAN